MKKKIVEEFFELFVKNYLVEDIIVLDKIEKNKITGLGACTIPQAMAVLTGIDLLGLLFGNYKDTNDTKNHISEFYRITKRAYRDNQYDDDIIEKLILSRHGMMHNFFPKSHAKNIGICKSKSENLIIKESFGEIEIESINVSVLTRDFLLAVSLLETMIAENSDDLFFDNILISIKDLGYSNQLAITTTNRTTMNIVTQSKRK